MPLLTDFSDEVVASHTLIVAEFMAGERPSTDTLRELAAEIIATDKLAVMAARSARTIQAARDSWQSAHACFEACLKLWNQLPASDPLAAGHRRLLKRLLANADDRRTFYSVTDHDREAFNAGRDHGFSLAHAEIQ